jgi:hypothetical protein
MNIRSGTLFIDLNGYNGRNGGLDVYVYLCPFNSLLWNRIWVGKKANVSAAQKIWINRTGWTAPQYVY